MTAGVDLPEPPPPAARTRRVYPGPAIVVLLVLVTGLVVRTTSDDAPRAIPNLYAQALSGVTSGVALPASRPPDLDWVFLSSGDGDQVVSFQHSDVIVRICRWDPDYGCGSYATEIRTFRFHGVRYRMVYVPLGKLAPPPGFSIRPELLEYWSAVGFVARQPAWLTMDLYPGGAYQT
jgi:hypothetical protein